MESHNQNKLLFYGLIAYLVLFYAQPAGRFPVLRPFRIELVLGLLLSLGAVLEFAQGRLKITENKINLAMIAFFFFLFMSIPFALVKTRAFDGFIRVAKLFPIYLMIISSVHDERRLKLFMYVYLGLIGFIFVEPILKGHYVYNNHMMRLGGVTGYFAHPNHLGMIASSHLAFYYYLMFYERSPFLKCAHFALLLFGLRAVMLTQSRTGMLGVVSFAGFVWLFGKRKIAMSIGMVLCLIVVWQFMPEKSKERFMSLSKIGTVFSTDRRDFAEEEKTMLGSMASRLELVRRSLIAFVENPVIGVGLNCFSSWSGQRWRSWWFPPHNTYLQALAEFGIIGTSLFFGIIYYIFRNLRLAEKMLAARGEGQRFVRALIKPLRVYFLIFAIVAFFGIEIFANVWYVVGGLSVVILRIASQGEGVPSHDEVNRGAAAG